MLLPERAAVLRWGVKMRQLLQSLEGRQRQPCLVREVKTKMEDKQGRKERKRRLKKEMKTTTEIKSMKPTKEKSGILDAK